MNKSRKGVIIMRIFFIIIVFWVNTLGQTFLDRHWLIFNKENSPISSNIINSIDTDSEGNYWIVTAPEFADTQIVYNGYLHKMKNNNWIIFDNNNSPLDKNIVEDVAITADGKVLVATVNGLYILSNNNWDSLNTSNSQLPDNFIYRVTIDKQNRYWLGIPNYGVGVYDNGSLIFYDDNNSFQGIADFNFIEVDSSNNIWIGSNNFGLYSFDGNYWRRRINGPFGSGVNEPNMIVGLSVANQNLKWVSINILGGGWKIGYTEDDSTWFYFDHNIIGLDSLNRLSYEGVVVDKNNIKWFGSRDGLIKCNNFNWSVLDSTNSPIPSNSFGVGIIDQFNNKIYGLANLGLIFYNEDSVIVSSVEENYHILNNFYLLQNYPNPFNPITKIKFSIPHSAVVQINVYDVLGKEIKTLLNEYKQAGTYEVEFSTGSFGDASSLPSGVYFYRMISGGYAETKKMLLLR